MIKLVADRVAIIPIENPEKIGSIIVPEIAKDRLNQGFVKYTGPEVKDLKIGMYVIFSGYTGTLVHIEGEGKFIIMPERFVKAIVQDANILEIPGLYFKQNNRSQTALEVTETLMDIMPDLDLDTAIGFADKLIAKGITTEESYFVGSYETTMNLTAQAFAENKEWRDKIIVANAKENDREAKEYLDDEES